MNRSSLSRIIRASLVYAIIIAATLVAIDLVCMALGLFPLPPRYGDPVLGWRGAPATGRMSVGKCVEFSTGDTFQFARNEDGVRTTWSRSALLADSTRVVLGVIGDSHTDLCSPNEQLHAGVLEASLDSAGVPATVLTYGAGRYSPLQAYLAFQEVLAPYAPKVMVLNVYTGNDFYDLLRSDDRPHFVGGPDAFRIAPPTWYAFDDPARPRRSRVMFALRNMADAVGLRGAYFRISELRRLGTEQGTGYGTVLQYIWDLWKAREPTVGYPDALSAQMLNQQLFFANFPMGVAASKQRMQALLALIREQNPGMLLLMSPIPSYELSGQAPVDSALLRVLQRLPITYESGQAQELALYDWLREAATASGWLFADNLASFREYHGSARLYNDFDYHLLPVASAIIGRTQATALEDTLRAFRGVKRVHE